MQVGLPPLPKEILQGSNTNANALDSHSDTLYSITKKHGTTLDKLKKLNPKENPYSIQIGKKLRVKWILNNSLIILSIMTQVTLAESPYSFLSRGLIIFEYCPFEL
ncbi:LysM domain-containing protein [Peribacillus frigoritolerans]